MQFDSGCPCRREGVARASRCRRAWPRASRARASVRVRAGALACAADAGALAGAIVRRAARPRSAISRIPSAGSARCAAGADRAVSRRLAGAGADGVDLPAGSGRSGALRPAESGALRRRARRCGSNQALGSERAIADGLSAGAGDDERSARMDAAARRRRPCQPATGDGHRAGAARPRRSGRHAAGHRSAARVHVGPGDHHRAGAIRLRLRAGLRSDGRLRAVVGRVLSAVSSGIRRHTSATRCTGTAWGSSGAGRAGSIETIGAGLVPNGGRAGST